MFIIFLVLWCINEVAVLPLYGITVYPNIFLNSLKIKSWGIFVMRISFNKIFIFLSKEINL